VKPIENHEWVTVALGFDVNIFIGETETHLKDEVVGMYLQLVPGATRVTGLRRTMDRTWQARLWSDEEDLGYYALYEEDK
jgi:hypothetical protein